MAHVVARLIVVLCALAGVVVVGLTPAPIAAQTGSGTVTMQWLGWSHYRFTSPTGKVVLTNPNVNNPDSPVRLEDIRQADIILPADGHGDDMGSAVDIANNTGGTIVAPSFEMGGWFMERGVPSNQVFRPGGPGDRAVIGGITIRIVNSIHGSGLGQNATPGTAYGGPAAGFMITFENGWTVYFSGSSAATQDQALWAQMYQPDLAILHLTSQSEPMDFAMQAKLMMTGNPNLTTLFPHHHRAGLAGGTAIVDAQAALDNMGVPLTITEPFPGVEYTFTK